MRTKAVSTIMPFCEQGLVSLGNFVMFLLAARKLPEVDLGLVGYTMTVYLICVVVSVSVVFQHATTVAAATGYSTSYKGKLIALHSVVVLIMLLFSLAVFYLVVPAGLNTSYALGFASFIVVQQMTDGLRRIFYIFQQDLEAFKVSFLVNVPRIVLLAVLDCSTYLDFILVLVLSGVYSVFLYCFETRYVPGCGFSTRFISLHARQSFWLWLTGPLGWAWNSVPVFMLGSIKGVAMVGVFTSIRSVSNFANVFLELLETKYAAFMASNRGKDSEVTSTKVFICALCFWAVLVVLAAQFGRELITLMFGERMAEWHLLLPMLMILQMFVFFFRKSAVGLRVVGKYSSISLVYLVGLLLVVVISIASIDSFSIYGVGFALLGSAAVMTYAAKYFEVKFHA